MPTYLLFVLQLTSILIFIFLRHNIKLQITFSIIWLFVIITSMIIPNNKNNLINVIFLAAHLLNIYYEYKFNRHDTKD